MGIFSFGKNNSRYWLNSRNEVACPGDECKHKCSEKCPIWLNTEAMELIMSGNPKAAVVKLKKAVDIEPRFIDVHRNLGAAYGLMGEFEKSINSYNKILSFDPNDERALFGLATSYKNAKKYDEALEACDRCEKAGGDLSRISSIRRECGDDSEDESKNQQWVKFMNTILTEETEKGHIDYRGGYPNIPEIANQTIDAFIKVNLAAIETIDDPFTLLSTVAVWCAYAAMAMVKIWDSDFSNFKIEHMIDDIIDARGFNKMDEYVYDVLGIEFGGNDNDPLRLELFEIVERHKDWIIQSKSIKEDSFALIAAMFNYGMIYEMAKLGMH